MIENILKVGSDISVPKRVTYYYGNSVINVAKVKAKLNDSNWFRYSPEVIQNKLDEIYKENYPVIVNDKFDQAGLKDVLDSSSNMFEVKNVLFNYIFDVAGVKKDFKIILRENSTSAKDIESLYKKFSSNYALFTKVIKTNTDLFTEFLNVLYSASRNTSTNTLNLEIDGFYPQSFKDMFLILDPEKSKNNLLYHRHMCELLDLNPKSISALMAFHSVNLQKNNNNINILKLQFSTVYYAFEYFVSQEDSSISVHHMLSVFKNKVSPEVLNRFVNLNLVFNYYLAKVGYITSNEYRKKVKHLNKSKNITGLSKLLDEQSKDYFKDDATDFDITDLQKRLFLFLCKIDGKLVINKNSIILQDRNNVVIPKGNLEKINLNHFNKISVQQLLKVGLLSPVTKDKLTVLTPNKQYKNHL